MPRFVARTCQPVPGRRLTSPQPSDDESSTVAPAPDTSPSRPDPNLSTAPHRHRDGTDRAEDPPVEDRDDAAGVARPLDLLDARLPLPTRARTGLAPLVDAKLANGCTPDALAAQLLTDRPEHVRFAAGLLAKRLEKQVPDRPPPAPSPDRRRRRNETCATPTADSSTPPTAATSAPAPPAHPPPPSKNAAAHDDDLRLRLGFGSGYSREGRGMTDRTVTSSPVERRAATTVGSTSSAALLQRSPKSARPVSRARAKPLRSHWEAARRPCSGTTRSGRYLVLRIRHLAGTTMRPSTLGDSPEASQHRRETCPYFCAGTAPL